MMMDAEIELENWCNKNNIDCSKIAEHIWEDAVREVERAMDDCLNHYQERNLEDGVSIIEREVEEHPELKKDALSEQNEVKE